MSKKEKIKKHQDDCVNAWRSALKKLLEAKRV